ncbi:PP2C family protein-serine/threonine phosphatase [Streptomyces sp. ME19-01-6]|uniref:PP2C family protein-serine/threonine phosphatase n=1 Tax=Streptomyces sp. ME19-01-6 TaxID=3028686 RepID=UPI0029ADD08E|nr:PP2C family protein-serine/threonine phosphatase [Streptomyces sp. ME19-01-6]MDX3224154.1 PP2C family protein-serine/threonine phosphatase [Streptomyces sp. ME19-01-6]
MQARLGRDRGVFAALVAYAALIGTLDAVTADAAVRLAPFAVLAPLAAAALLSLRMDAAVCGLYLVLTCLNYSLLTPGISTGNRVVICTSALAVCGVSLMVCRMRLGREERIKRLRLTAGAAQRLLLRSLPLLTGDVTADGFYEAAEREATVGGDIYEVLWTPYGTRMVIGDVRGKGLPAIGASAAVLTAFRESAFREPDLRTVVERMEEGLLRWENVSAREPEEEFVTALVAETLGRDMRVIDCGHVPPFILADGRATEARFEEPGLPLGLADLAPTPRRWQDLKVPSGGRVLLCTDGIIEARSPQAEYYPLAERLGAWAELPTGELLERLHEDLSKHVGGVLTDDAAVLVVQRRGIKASLWSKSA